MVQGIDMLWWTYRPLQWSDDHHGLKINLNVKKYQPDLFCHCLIHNLELQPAVQDLFDGDRSHRMSKGTHCRTLNVSVEEGGHGTLASDHGELPCCSS